RRRAALGCRVSDEGGDDHNRDEASVHTSSTSPQVVSVGDHALSQAGRSSCAEPTADGRSRWRWRMMLTRAGLALALALCVLAAALSVGAQPPDRMPRIGVLMGLSENDPEATLWLSGFTQGLQELGWIDGRNLRLEVRWASGNSDRTRMFAKELVDLRPDVILSHGTPVTAALQKETRMIPIVFVT